MNLNFTLLGLFLSFLGTTILIYFTFIRFDWGSGSYKVPVKTEAKLFYIANLLGFVLLALGFLFQVVGFFLMDSA